MKLDVFTYDSEIILDDGYCVPLNVYYFFDGEFQLFDIKDLNLKSYYDNVDVIQEATEYFIMYYEKEKQEQYLEEVKNEKNY